MSALSFRTGNMEMIKIRLCGLREWKALRRVPAQGALPVSLLTGKTMAANQIQVIRRDTALSLARYWSALKGVSTWFLAGKERVRVHQLVSSFWGALARR